MGLHVFSGENEKLVVIVVWWWGYCVCVFSGLRDEIGDLYIPSFLAKE